jgi:hypothetical protein
MAKTIAAEIHSDIDWLERMVGYYTENAVNKNRTSSRYCL